MLGMDDNRSEESFDEGPAEEAPPAEERRLLRKLKELKRFGANISTELDKDTPCKGTISRELLDLELRALEQDYGLTEKKLDLLRSTVEVAPWHGSYGPHHLHRTVNTFRETSATFSPRPTNLWRSPERFQGTKTQPSSIEYERAACTRESAAARPRRNFDARQSPASRGHGGGFPEKGGDAVGEDGRKVDRLGFCGRRSGTRASSSMCPAGGRQGQHSRSGPGDQAQEKKTLSVQVTEASFGVDQRQKQQEQKQKQRQQQQQRRQRQRQQQQQQQKQQKQQKQQQQKQQQQKQQQQQRQQRQEWQVAAPLGSDVSVPVVGSPRHCGAVATATRLSGEPRALTNFVDRGPTKGTFPRRVHDEGPPEADSEWPPCIQSHARRSWSWQGQIGNCNDDGNGARRNVAAPGDAPKSASLSSPDLLHGAAADFNNEQGRFPRPPDEYHLQGRGFHRGHASYWDSMRGGPPPREPLRGKTFRTSPRREESLHEEERVVKRPRFQIRQSPGRGSRRKLGADRVYWPIEDASTDARVRHTLESAQRTAPVAMDATNRAAGRHEMDGRHIDNRFVEDRRRSDIRRADNREENGNDDDVLHGDHSNDHRYADSCTPVVYGARGGSRQADRWWFEDTRSFGKEGSFGDKLSRHVCNLNAQTRQQHSERRWPKGQPHPKAQESEFDRWHSHGKASRRLPYPGMTVVPSNWGGGWGQRELAGYGTLAAQPPTH